MESNITLTVGFKGAVNINGLGMFNPSGAPLSVGGVLSLDNTETAYFGRVVSEDPAAPHEFDVGKPGSNNIVGIILNEQAVQENDPAKPDYLLPGFPVTVVIFGPVWLASWTKVVGTDPARGYTVIARNTTGQIEFIAPTTAVPSGWTALPCVILDINEDTNGVLLFYGINSDTTPIIDDAGHQLSALPFASDSVHPILIGLPWAGTVSTGIKPNMTDSWTSGAPVGFYFDDGGVAITKWGECFTVGQAVLTDSEGEAQTGFPYTAFFYTDIEADIKGGGNQCWNTLMTSFIIGTGKTLRGLIGASSHHVSVDVNGTLYSDTVLSCLSFGGNWPGTVNGLLVPMDVRPTNQSWSAFAHFPNATNGCFQLAAASGGTDQYLKLYIGDKLCTIAVKVSS